VIVAVHVASGAVGGALAPSRRAAVVVGLALHVLGDRIPHYDMASRRFEVASGVGGLLLLAVTDGPLARTTLGALASSAPDVEHVLPLPRPGGRKLFPSHRVIGWHRSGGVPASVQVLAAGVALGWLAGSRARRR
jgi:hypothetical protein